MSILFEGDFWGDFLRRFFHLNRLSFPIVKLLFSETEITLILLFLMINNKRDGSIFSHSQQCSLLVIEKK